MIVLSDKEYRTLMGSNWRMGMLSETMKIFNARQDIIFIHLQDALATVAEYAVNHNLNADHVIGIYMTTDPQDGTMEEDDLKMIHTLRDSDIVPCYVFEAPDITTVEQLVEVVTRVGNLRAFL